MSESALLREIREALEAMGYLVRRLPSGGYRGRVMLMPKGTPDLLVVLHHQAGRTGFVETKWTHKPNCKCKHCVAQRVFAEQAKKCNAVYVIARSRQEAFLGLGLELPF